MHNSAEVEQPLSVGFAKAGEEGMLQIKVKVTSPNATAKRTKSC
jgi:hypothetical protein